MAERKDIFGSILHKAEKIKAKDAIMNVPALPKLIDIELTNTCNLACKFCPTGCKTLKRPEGFMEVSLAWDIMEQCSKYGNIPVRFCRWGECTLHPNFWGIVKLFTLADIPVQIHTNGIKLDVENCIKDEVDSVKISVHNLAGYRAAEELIDARGDKEKPFIHVAYLDGEQQYDELSGVDKTTRSRLYSLSEKRHNIPECYEVFTRLSVDWDGKVTACCGDYDRKMIVGDLTLPGATIKNIWKGHQLQGYRNLIARKEWDKLPLCRNCARGGG